MEKGSIKEKGNYKALLEDKNSEFYKMHQYWVSLDS